MAVWQERTWAGLPQTMTQTFLHRPTYPKAPARLISSPAGSPEPPSCPGTHSHSNTLHITPTLWAR